MYCACSLYALNSVNETAQLSSHISMLQGSSALRPTQRMLVATTNPVPPRPAQIVAPHAFAAQNSARDQYENHAGP
eukprot:11160958-Lingulodinium_polyedra.AAC.1